MEGQNRDSSSNSRDNATSFLQFSDQLRLHTAVFSALSLGDSIWSDASIISATAAAADPWTMTYTSHKLAFNTYTTHSSRYNTVENHGRNTTNSIDAGKNVLHYNNYSNDVNNYKYGGGAGGEIKKNYFNKAVGKLVNTTTNNRKNSNDVTNVGKKKKNSNGNGNYSNKSNNNDDNGAVDKRFKSLPPAEALPRNEAIGGYIFVCNNETMPENLRLQLFGLPSRYRDSVRAIKPGLPLFLYNYSTHQLYGIFEAASFGGSNIDPTAWEDKKFPGESRFPAQVKVVTRRICDPLEEDAFRPILHHYDGPKFRLELNVEEAVKLLDIFAENDA
ncbi:DCD domain-containing protein NRP-B-like [Curcuma longa]|uniref:DCD domain-containing protein NRP-B-like n=1 Tax=Curcuma longa TaxID=136217 RepID=UPI003D9F92FE